MEYLKLLKDTKADGEYLRIAKGKYKYPSGWKMLWNKIKLFNKL